MGRRRSGITKEKKAKKVSVKLIQQKNAGNTTGPYRIMEMLIDDMPALSDLSTCETKIAIAWMLDAKEDADGRVKFGATKRGSDLDREMHHFDFVLLINKKLWDQATERQQQAMMFHRLLCCAVSKDKNGDPKEDEEGRTVYRQRRPDVVGFKEEFAHFGMWSNDLEAAFVKLCEGNAKGTPRPLLDAIEAKAAENGEAAVDTGESVAVHKRPVKKQAKKAKRK